MSGKTIGVISIKGGVGKTTLVTNLGASLAKDFGKKVLLVDGNLTAPNLGLHLGIVEPKLSIHDVLYNNANLKDAIMKTEHGFDILPGVLVPSGSQRGRINPYKLHNRLSHIKEDYDLILVDSSPNLTDEMLSTMIASDEIIVVTSPDHPTLSCTMHAVKVAKERKTPISGLVLNKVRGKRFEIRPEEVENATGVPILSVIGDDTKILESLSRNLPAHYSGSVANAPFSLLASKIVGEPFKAPDFKEKVFDFISRLRS